MTPIAMEILVHYIGHANDYRDGDFSAPAVRELIDWFKGEGGLLEEDDSRGSSRAYRLTEKGRVFTDAVLATPMPVQIWSYRRGSTSTGERE